MRWLVINKGTIVDIIESETNLKYDEIKIEFDTVQLDDESIFKECGETFNVDKMIPITEITSTDSTNFSFNPFKVVPR